ncbi:MAG: inosine-5-monophosphate dehydrogenase [Rhizobiaceae bacterium MnEN-MB40S]|nr:MAG: inosine-5-monophosphate dehydrogenase [Rhizobiaceae bacterium MnEN-MB40S]
MTVKAILDQKGREVITVTPEISLSEANARLAEYKIGAVVVVDKSNRICGILSERDIVRALAAKGVDAMSGPVSSAMTANVKVCSETHSVNQLMEMMTQGRFRHLPVEVDGKLGGLVSIGDVVRLRIEQVEREAEEIKAYIAS